jgi:hypothetical protein
MFVVSSFSKYFNMTGWRLGWVVAPERHVRDLEKLAPEPLHLAADGLAARRARVLHSGNDRARRGAAACVPRSPRFPGSGAAGAGLRDPGRCRRADSSSYADSSSIRCRQPGVLPRSARGSRRCDHAGLDFGHHRAESHVRLAYTIGMAKLEDGIERLRASWVRDDDRDAEWATLGVTARRRLCPRRSRFARVRHRVARSI